MTYRSLVSFLIPSDAIHLSKLTTVKKARMPDAFSLFFDCGAKLLNVPQIFDNFDPAGCQIVESFSAFDNIGPIWCQIVESTSPIRQFWPPR